MNSAYDGDRIIGILTRVRACLGIAIGVILMGVCAMAGSIQPSSGPKSTYTDAQGRALDPQMEAIMRANEAERNVSKPNPAAALTGILFLVALVVFAISVFEYTLGGWIGNGERRGFLWGAITEGLSCFLGLFNMTKNPLAGIGFLLSLVTCVYCIARQSGTGPEPV